MLQCIGWKGLVGTLGRWFRAVVPRIQSPSSHHQIGKDNSRCPENTYPMRTSMEMSVHIDNLVLEWCWGKIHLSSGTAHSALPFLLPCVARDTTTSDATCDNVLTYSLCIVSRAVLVSSGGAVTSSWDTCLQSDEGDRKDKILEWGSLNSTLQPVLGNTIDT